MGKSAWRDFVPPDDGTWVDLRPGEPGYDPIIAARAKDEIQTAPVNDGIPREYGVFFGIPFWTPGRENGVTRIPFAVDQYGQVMYAEACPVCGKGKETRGLDIGQRIICMNCMRADDIDHRIAEALAEDAA